MEILRKLGLTGNEVKVYLALLRLGSVTAGEIIKSTDLHRAGTYDTLKRLMERGLVSYVIKANRKYFEAASPKTFLEVLERKEEELKKEKLDLLEAIAELEKKRSLSKEEQEVTLFKGYKGLKSIFQDWFEEGKEILVIGAYSEEAEGLQHAMKYSLPQFHKKRVKNKQPMRFVFPEKSAIRAKQLTKYKYTFVRIFQAPFASNSSIQVYGDKVAIILWSRDPIGIVIRSKEIAKSYRDYFNMLWDISKSLLL